MHTVILVIAQTERSDFLFLSFVLQLTECNFIFLFVAHLMCFLVVEV